MGGLGELNLGALVFLAVVALTTLVLLTRTHRQLRRRPRETAAVVHAERTRPGPQRRPAPPSDQLARWEVEMHDLARDLMGQLDSKIILVERLIADADRAAARLEAASGAANGPSAARTAPSIAPPATPPQLATPQRQPDQAAGLGARREQLAPAAQEFPQSPRGAAGGDATRYDAIYRLADAGQSSAAIAAKTGAPVGEVELILSLRATT